MNEQRIKELLKQAFYLGQRNEGADKATAREIIAELWIKSNTFCQDFGRCNCTKGNCEKGLRNS